MTKHKSKIGRIYKKRRKLADGTFVDHSTWTVRYQKKDYATGERDAKKAEKFLLKLAGAIAQGKQPEESIKETSIITMDQLFDLRVARMKRLGRKTAREREGRIRKHLRPFFGTMDASKLADGDITRYVDMRLETMPAPQIATINDELRQLKATLINAKKRVKLIREFPEIELLPGEKIRCGFLDHADYVAIKAELPPYLVPVFVAGYHVGNRRGELTQIELRDIDMKADMPQFRLYPDATKNGEGRLIPILAGEMLDVFKQQIAMTKRDYPECRWLFHNEGEQILTFYKAWNTALGKVHLEGLMFHDLRRTAVRNLTRAGVPRSVACKITGHKTEKVYERYNITDERDIQGAADKLTSYLTKEAAKLQG